jgi:Flp pilus assembly protein TadD
MVAVPLAAATLYGVARRPAAGFLGAWFLVILAPTSLVPVAEQTMAEHRIYLSLAAVAAAAVLGAHALWGRRIAAPAVVLAAILGSLTVLRNRDYGSAFTLWQGAAASEPGSECAHSGYGVALAESGRLPEAIGEFEEAIRLMPGYAEAQNNLGVALCVQGRLGEGIRHMEAALEVQPGYSEAHFDLGKALEQEGRVPEALRHYEEAVRLRPGFVDAENNLGLLLCREGRVDEGIGRLREAIREDPANVRPHASLGTVLVQQGRRAEAAAEFERIVELNPGDAAARRMVEYLRGSR